MKAIINIAKNNPNCIFWLPMKEYAIYNHIKNDIPKNLIIRVSHPMKNAIFNNGKYKHHCGAITKDYINTFIEKYGKNKICPAYKQKGKCNGCTKCWNSNIDLIAYILH